jgi:hypothetical protein
MPIRRVHRFLANRRKASRHKAEHEISLIAGVALGDAGSTRLLTGRTRDISETGLSLSLPIDDEHQRALMAVGEPTRILLVLPTKTIHIRGEIVRSLQLDGNGQLIGVKITRMDADDKAAYAEYLSSLG